MSFIPLGVLAASGAGGGGAYESIATAVGTGSSDTITFSSIPSTFKHLQVRAIMRDTTANTTIASSLFRINSDTGANYALHWLYGDGSTAQATGSASTTYYSIGRVRPNNSNTAGVMGVTVLDIHDYASSTKNKTIRALSGCETNATSGSADAIYLSSGLWINTNAITSLQFVTTTAWTTTTTFALYGIKG